MSSDMAIHQPITQIDTPGDLHQISQYQLVRALGSGGMGVVYEAVHVRLRRHVALKVLSPQFATSEYAINRFEREMATIGQLSHPNIVQALDAGVDRSTHFLAMEFVDGPNVESVCQRAGVLQVDDACEIVRQAALGLAHAHSFGIVHRDIKPSNLLMTRVGTVKIADLGLARYHAHADEEPLTAHGAVLGTYDYMSPEQAGGGNVGPESDLYSLGATLFRLLAGKPIFSGPGYSTTVQKLNGHLSDPPPRLATIRSDISEALDDIIQRLLAKNPSERPSSAREVFDALGPLSKHACLTALLDAKAEPPHSDFATQTFWSGATKYPPVPEPRPKRLRGLWIGLGVVLVLASVGVFWWLAPGAVSISPPGGKSVAPAVVEPNRAPPVFEDLHPQDLELMRWYPLLNREPKRIIWPADALSSIHFDPAPRSRLNASCADLGILSFGRIAVPGYRLRMDLHQNQWRGDVGLILGLRPNTEAAGGYRAQCLLFRTMDAPRQPRRLTLRRTQMIFTPNPDGEFRVQRLKTFDSIVNLPTGLSETIELEVLPAGLSHIRWIGADVTGLCTPEANQAFTPEDYSGDFGVFLLEADCTVSSVQLMPLKR
jgi:serine/threonine protein kinase